MCGIAGVLYFDRSRKVDLNMLRSMTDTIVHRGPDDEGHFIDGNVGLGFRRLSIIDLNTGHQPLSNVSKNKHIIFNGEIYNYPELRTQLLSKGYQFQTKSDTEVILNLYEEYGEECVTYLRGMFAFVIWDQTNRKLFGVRDRFGIKPFYYYVDSDKIIFASEIKAIKRCRDVNLSLNSVAVDQYFSYGYMLEGHSIYQQIVHLPPAHSISLMEEQSYQLKISRYWNVRFDPDESKTEEMWLEELRHSFQNTVKCHMISDVPIGAFLSGGIDSSSVVAMMSKQSDIPIKTFSIGFKEKDFSELEYARAIAKEYHTEHYEKIVEPTSINILPSLVAAYDEPFGDSSAIPTYFVSEFASQYVKVVLSGDGGDELFAGYQSYLKFHRLIRFSWLPDTVRRLIFHSLYSFWPTAIPGKGILYYLSKKTEEVAAYACLWYWEERKKLFKSDFLELLNTQTSEKFKINLLNSSVTRDDITKLQELDIHTYLTNDILIKTDRVSMAHSLEVRVPILDHVFAEKTFEIPSYYKLRENRQKYIFKKAMEPYLPKKVFNHKKQGFGVPLKYWFKDDLYEYLLDQLNSSNDLISQYLNLPYVLKMIATHKKGYRDLSAKVWLLLFFSEWLNQQKQ